MALVMSDIPWRMKLMTGGMNEIPCSILLHGARDERHSMADEAHDRRHERDSMLDPAG
jgi:hypothetical protein